MISSFKTFFRSCFRDQHGSISTTFAFASVVLIGCSGVAVDYGRARLMHAQLQNNLDAAVLAGISGSTDAQKQIKTAQRYFDRWAGVQPIAYRATFSAKNGTLTATASAIADTSLLRVLNINKIDVAAKSTATAGDIDTEPMCFMAMHPTRAHTLEMKGTVKVVAPDCHIYGNSNHEYDVVDPHTPDNFLTAKSVAAIGGGHHYLENVTPPVEFGTKLIPDPLQSMSMPSIPNCGQTGLRISAKSRTLPAGRFCNGLIIEKGSKVTLQKGGTYYISGGPLNVNASELIGENVTIFLTDSKATIEWNKAVVRISAPTSGTYAGIAIFGTRLETDNLIQESTADIHGTVYMPNGAFDWINAGEPTITAKWTAYVIDGVTWDGSGTIRYNFRPDESDIPYPAALRVIPRPGKARLTN